MKGSCLPSIDRGAIGRKFEKSTFADRLVPGKNGLAIAGAIEGVAG
jgi:hypothetical protein